MSSSTAPSPRAPRATAADAGPVSGALHLLLGGWILAMLWLGSGDAPRYRMLLQEDQIIEWATVWLFVAAGVLGLRRSIRSRRVFDGMVALFCLFVAGEEFSWGQRLLGYFPPEFFLRNNFQQELNLHNLPQSVQPGWFLMAALAGYGVLLPLLSKTGRVRTLPGRVGATAPPLVLTPWYAVAIALLWWYPLPLTGEWVECLSGSLFLVSTRPGSMTLWTTLLTTIAFGAAMTPLAGALERGRDEHRMACARAEVQALADDLAMGEAATSRLWEMRRIHKRIWSSINEGYVDQSRLRSFIGATCADAPATTAQLRRRYGIDPWGSAYWLLVEEGNAAERRVRVYSFGPNRRRDSGDITDDVAATRTTHAEG